VYFSFVSILLLSGEFAIFRTTSIYQPCFYFIASFLTVTSNLYIHNTLARQKQAFAPIEPGKVRMYVCGPTVYDFCHIGNARPWVVFDVVQRWLRATGYVVTYVRNITDIDDKIIKRAVENNETCKSLTERFTKFMHEDCAALGVQAPDHEPIIYLKWSHWCNA
jgi:cysteinyl-tRNA synthetase